MIRNLFGDMTKYLPSKVAPAVIRIISLPILTRLFLPASYGKYMLVMATVSILLTFSGWINMSVVRFYPGYEKQGKGGEFTKLMIRLGLLSISSISGVFLCILFLLRGQLSEDFRHLMSIGICVFASVSFFEIMLYFLRIKRLINWYSAFFVWKSITSLLFGVSLVILFRFEVEGLLWGSVLSIGVVAPFLWKVAVNTVRSTSNSLSFKHAVEMAKYSFPLVVGNLAAWVLSLSDRYMLEAFRTSYEVGLYSVSYQISDGSIMIFISLFLMAFGPLSILLWERGIYEETQQFMAKGTRYFLLLCIPAIFGISILRNPIVMLLSTPTYYEGAKIIPFVVLGVFFLGFNQIFGTGLSLYKKTNFIMYSLILAALANLGLNFLFIPKYGYMAAAITTLISYALMVSLTIFFSRRFFVWQFPFKSLADSICASLVAAAPVCYLINTLNISAMINVILGLGVLVIVYTVVLYLLGEFQKEEKEVMRQILAKYSYLNIKTDEAIQKEKE